MRFTFITGSPELAVLAENAGVDTVLVDLEILGKRERQGHLSTVISGHTLADISRVRSVLRKAALLVRVNPLHEGSPGEVDSAIRAGADLLMLPMFRAALEIDAFSRLVRGRTPIVGLIETPEAVEDADAIVRVAGLSEVYVGLNDLHLRLGLKFMFEPLALGIVDRLAEIARKRGLPFGFGGIARHGHGLLPAERVMAEHLRLGSTRVILSRTFYGDGTLDFRKEVQCLRDLEKHLSQRPPDVIEEDRRAVHRTIHSIALNLANKQ